MFVAMTASAVVVAPSARVDGASPATTATSFTVHTGIDDAVVVVQLTTDNYSGGSGWTSAFNCAAGFQGTSSLNNTADPIASNLVIVSTDHDGDFCVRAQDPTDLVVDELGTLDGAKVSSPTRVFDSRATAGVPDSTTPATDRRVHIGPASSTVVLQVTTDHYGNGGTGWTAVYDCATGFQGTSSLNNESDPISSNTVIAATDANGDVCVRSQAPTDLVVDSTGTLSGASIGAPTRVFDSRTVRAAGLLPTTMRTTVHIGPANTAVVLQVTTDNFVTGDGWTSVFTCATGYHDTSSINNVGSPVASNLVMVPTDAHGDVCVSSQHPSDIIVDLIGTLASADIHAPSRLMDTRFPIGAISYAPISPDRVVPRVDPATAISNALAGLTPGVIASATYTTRSSGPGLGPRLAVTVDAPGSADGSEFEAGWEVALLVGSVAEQISTTDDLRDDLHGADVTYVHPDGTTDVEDVAMGNISARQAFAAMSWSDDLVQQTIATTLAAHGLVARSIDVLHAIGPAPKVVIAVASSADLHGQLGQIESELDGHGLTYPGLYLEVDLTDGTPIARLLVSFRNGEGGEWVAPGYDDLGAPPHG
ncbi:MAG: hypothetical protein JWN39_3868 [Ilumatobacteraceae bacterium]|nr:hypothetical protein [Ilumatobacteraceae bacterium]